jgi:hypothetical protein
VDRPLAVPTLLAQGCSSNPLIATTLYDTIIF